jgi:hypothetical protein
VQLYNTGHSTIARVNSTQPYCCQHRFCCCCTHMHSCGNQADAVYHWHGSAAHCQLAEHARHRYAAYPANGSNGRCTCSCIGLPMHANSQAAVAASPTSMHCSWPTCSNQHSQTQVRHHAALFGTNTNTALFNPDSQPHYQLYGTGCAVNQVYAALCYELCTQACAGFGSSVILMGPVGFRSPNTRGAMRVRKSQATMPPAQQQQQQQRGSDTNTEASADGGGGGVGVMVLKLLKGLLASTQWLVSAHRPGQYHGHAGN